LGVWVDGWMDRYTVIIYYRLDMGIGMVREIPRSLCGRIRTWKSRS
jgi:hypothetical protein